ncbi:hypothetical protein Tco_1095518, partial [Tanacetum coccineum]
MEENKSINRSDIQKDLYNALVESYSSDKDIISSYGDVVTLKRGRDDQDKDEDPSAGLNRGSKKRRSSKEVESSKEPTHKESKSTKHSHQEFNTGDDDVIPVRETLEDASQGSSIQKYTTSITKIKAADYGQVKWIEDKVSRIWSPDDQLYKFREGDFKRLRRQDIEDMLLLLVQGKLTNLNLEERYALNVALRMFTRRIVIQERVEDLQLGIESYQKKINLTKPKTYLSDLKRMTPYTAYPDIQGIIYEDEMNRNRLMLTDELHKFSDGTLNHVRTALNDIATGLQMDYLPKRNWSKQDKQRARVMINAIDRKLRDRRLMRNLEKFVGGRPYIGDLRLLGPYDLSYDNRRDLPRDIPLDNVVVLRYEKRSKSENTGKVSTEMELVLEQTQQGTSHEVSVSAEGVEELKIKVKIKGEKKEALLTLRQKLEHAEFDESNTYVLERFDTSARNHVKEILLKLNQQVGPHGFEGYLNMEVK